MPAQRARTRSTEIEFYEHKCQPRADWPKWLQDRFADALPAARAGEIATAHYDEGTPSWWRWFTEDEFSRQFETI